MDRPIIFSGPMVRALAAGRKTQTRRLASSPLRRCAPGDRLWVREAWSGIFWAPDDIDGPAREYWETPRVERTADLSSGVFYRAEEEAKPFMSRFAPEGQWTPSLHMPRWASRLTLIVAAVRVERLQTITEAAAKAEGCVWESADPPFWYVPGILPHSLTGVGVQEPGGRHAERSFGKLWDTLHVADGERWADDPEVVAVTFSVVRENIDRLPA